MTAINRRGLALLVIAIGLGTIFALWPRLAAPPAAPLVVPATGTLTIAAAGDVVIRGPGGPIASVKSRSV